MKVEGLKVSIDYSILDIVPIVIFSKYISEGKTMYKKWRLKRIGIFSAVKIGGTVSGVIGLIIGTIWGIMLAFFSSVIGYLFSLESTGFGFAALIFSPFLFAILYVFLGIIFSFLFALLYNLAAGILGGVQLEMDEEEKIEYKMRM